MDDALVVLESTQFQDTLTHEMMNTWTIRIEAFTHQYGRISPPLGSLTVGTVIIGVTHIHIERTQTLLPEAVEIRVVAMETAFGQSVIATLSVLQFGHPYVMRQNHIENLSIHPPQRFV